MSKKLKKALLSLFLVIVTLAGSMASSYTSLPVFAAGEAGKGTDKTPSTGSTGNKDGKYISDVFIAYGKDEKTAVKWLKDNGWEPIKGNNNFDAGKAHKNSICAAMGIKRTDNPDEAVTDMAVMNMSGGYSFPDYELLIDQKKAEIDEFIGTFIPTIEEYRQNYSDESSAGHTRAVLAHDLLNKFIDGGCDEKYAANDTGLPLGDLFLEPLMSEGGGDGSGDLEQIILESPECAVLAVESALALAADTADDTWLDRLPLLTEEELASDIDLYVPCAAGQDIAPSAIMQYYMQEYGDAAASLTAQWEDVHQRMLSYEDYKTAHDLWPHDGESDEAYNERYNSIIDGLTAEDNSSTDGNSEFREYRNNLSLYIGLYTVEYPGEWGETLGDFFNPKGDAAFSQTLENYLPMAVALSDGQRSAVDILSFGNLLTIGLSTEEGIEELSYDIDQILDEAESISVYSGSNRGIFRGGVALTSESLRELAKGNVQDPFTDPTDKYDLYNSLCWSGIIIGSIVAAAGIGFLLRAKYSTAPVSAKITQSLKKGEELSNQYVKAYKEYYDKTSYLAKNNWIEDYKTENPLATAEQIETAWKAHDSALLAKAKEAKNPYFNEMDNTIKLENSNKQSFKNTNTAIGAVCFAIGAAILIASIVSKCCALKKPSDFYDRDFSPIPTMIVEESDIVKYETDTESGETQRSIEFNQLSYYAAVSCNRQQVGNISGWQNGVSDYMKNGCGNVADLNADHGKEWLALYTVKSADKGSPILADSLILTVGDKNKPASGSSPLHFFGESAPADLADLAYCFKNKEGKMHFYWNTDPDAYKNSEKKAV